MANRMRKACQSQSKGFLSTTLSCAFEKDGTVQTEKETAGIADGVPRPNGPLAVWTTGVWYKEAMFMRYLEKSLVNAVEKWSTPTSRELVDTRRFVKEVKPVEAPVKRTWLSRVAERFRRT